MRHATLGLAIAVLVGGCLRPAEERALLDREVGRASADGVDVEVAEGLALVRSLERERVELWAQAPAFSLTVTWATPQEGLWITVHNAMPDAVLDLPHDVATTGLPTERTFYVSTPPSSLTVRVAPPDADLPLPFRFAALSDVQEAIDRVGDVWRRINAESGVRFVIGAGDLTQRGTREELTAFQQALRQLEVPYYPTLGNHELGSDAELWPRFFGRANTQFFFHDVAFTLLDSASATIDPLVYAALTTWLSRARDKQHVVAMHIPPIDPIGVRNGGFGSRDEASKLLGLLSDGGVDLTLYGHIHSYYSFFNAGIAAVISGGGGAIPERFDGVGRHFMVVDADPTSGLATRLVRVGSSGR